MEIKELKLFSEAGLRDMNELMHQLSASSCCTEERLRSVVDDDNSYLYVMREQAPVVSEGFTSTGLSTGAGFQESSRIIGCACLCVAHTPEFTLGFVEAVTVLSEYRGQHIGRKLMEHLIAEAKHFGVQSLHLTSNPRRVAANGLYRALGFEIYDTNTYTMSMKSGCTPSISKIIMGKDTCF